MNPCPFASVTNVSRALSGEQEQAADIRAASSPSGSYSQYYYSTAGSRPAVESRCLPAWAWGTCCMGFIISPGNQLSSFDGLILTSITI